MVIYIPSHLAGSLAFILFENKQWPWYQVIGWTGIMLVALEILSRLVLLTKPLFTSIPPKGKELLQLESIDWAYIWFNKLCTPLFTYHVLYFCWYSPNVSWSNFSLVNTILATIALFIVYDFFYTLYHKFLHLRGVYKYVHKHHHRQKAPTRGNIDAINVHPIEFVMGEYNHLLTMYLVSLFIPYHVLTGDYFYFCFKNYFLFIYFLFLFYPSWIFFGDRSSFSFFQSH